MKKIIAALTAATLLFACAPAAQQATAPAVKPAAAIGTRLVLVNNTDGRVYPIPIMSRKLAEAFKNLGYEVITSGANFDQREYNDTSKDRTVTADLAKKNDASFVVSSFILSPKKVNVPLSGLLGGGSESAQSTGVFTLISRDGASLNRFVVEKTASAAKFNDAYFLASDAVVEEGFIKIANAINP